MIVVDASVVMRQLRQRSPEASAVLRRRELAAPALLVVETANGLAKEIRFAGLEREAGAALLRQARELPIELVPDRELAVDALELAADLELSAYDAAYVALAERLNSRLVTADRKLAARYVRCELIV